jgi:hypothetical protein
MYSQQLIARFDGNVMFVFGRSRSGDLFRA